MSRVEKISTAAIENIGTIDYDESCLCSLVSIVSCIDIARRK
jgi:hypothetical protein